MIWWRLKYTPRGGGVRQRECIFTTLMPQCLCSKRMFSLHLSLVNCNLTSVTQLRISIPSDKVPFLQTLSTLRFPFSLQWRVEPTSLRLRVETQAEGHNCLVKPPGCTNLIVERWSSESGRIRTPMKNWMSLYNNAGGIWKLLGKMSSKNCVIRN